MKTQVEQVHQLYPILKRTLRLFFLCNYYYPPEINRAAEVLYGYVCSQMGEEPEVLRKP